MGWALLAIEEVCQNRCLPNCPNQFFQSEHLQLGEAKRVSARRAHTLSRCARQVGNIVEDPFNMPLHTQHQAGNTVSTSPTRAALAASSQLRAERPSTKSCEHACRQTDVFIA